MKKIYFLIIAALGFSMAGNAQTTWDNFEDQRKGTYGFINGTFLPYNQNLLADAVNPSLVAAQYTRNPAELFDVIVIDAPMQDLSDYISGAKQMSIDVWSPAPGITVQITLENSIAAEPQNFPTGRHSIYLTQTTVANTWETLTFSFDQQPDPSILNTNVDRLVLLFAPNTQTDDTYFFDNLRGPEIVGDECIGVTPDASILNDFECQQNVNYIFSHSGINFRRILNDNPDDTNMSEYCATYTRNGGEEFDVLIGRFDGNLELSPTSQISMDVRGTSGLKQITLSLQTATNDVIEAFPSFILGEGNWETLTFDVGSQAGNPGVEQFVILFDEGQFTSDVYQFDNMTVTGLVSTEDIDVLSDLVAFPNPAKDFVRVEYSLIENSDVNLTLTDITGRVVENRFIANQSVGKQYVEFDTSDYAEGIYLYNVQVSGQNNTGKIVVTD